MKKKHILKNEIEWCLKERPNTRNSDKLLWISVCYNFYCLDNWIPFKDLREFTDYIMIAPSEDDVKRWRARFNKEELYWPTDPEVLKHRRLKIKEKKEELGYTTQEQAIEMSEFKKQEKMDLKHWWEKD
jgi:hypothetical protein